MVAESARSEPISQGTAVWSSRDLADDLYRQLHAAARALLARQAANGSLAATALVHEAWLRLKAGKRRNWSSQADFCAATAQAIRHILIDHARRRHARKRGGDGRRVLLDSGALTLPEPEIGLLELNDALEQLTALDARQAKVVELRFFGGLTAQETAAALKVSLRTVQLDWRGARAWLRRELSRARSVAGLKR